MDKYQLRDLLINHMIETMDTDDLIQVTKDKLNYDYIRYSEDQLLKEITDWYPELLEKIK